MASRQVRLDADVARELAEKARGNGRSLAYEANEALRRTLGIPDVGDEARPVEQPSRARAVAMAAPGPCPHPGRRRLGGVCTACGRRFAR